MSDFTDNLHEKRIPITVGGNPSRFVELIGANEVFTSFYAPDPKTFREDYYYNTRQNILFKKIKAKHPNTKKLTYHWKPVSDL